MKRIPLAVVSASAVATIAIFWTVVAWIGDLGIELFMQPGVWIADLVLPDSPILREPFASIEQDRAHVKRYWQEWWFAVGFWVVVMPVLTFAGIVALRRDRT